MKKGDLLSLHLELDELMTLNKLLNRYHRYKEARDDGFSEEEFSSLTLIRLQVQGAIKFLDVEVVADEIKPLPVMPARDASNMR